MPVRRKPRRRLESRAKQIMRAWFGCHAVMKRTIALTALILCLLTSVTASQKRKPLRRTRSAPSRPRKAAAAPPAILGAQVMIATKTGEQITGQVLEVSPYGIRVKQDSLESTVPLESISLMRFGDAPAAAAAPVPASGHSPDFGREVESVMALFQAMDSATQSGTEYSDYGRRLIELRRATERFVGKYAGSDDQTETKMAALYAATADDYSRARTIWTQRLGQGPGATLSVSDSPAVADAVELYPELGQLGSRSKLPADKLVAGLWKQASLKIIRGRKILDRAM